MTNLLKFLLLAGMASSLSGCLVGSDGYVHNRENGYLQAQTIAPTKIPPTVSNVKLETTYPIPTGQLTTGTTPISIVPPGMPAATPKTSGRKATITNQMLMNEQVPTLKISSNYSQAWDAVIAQMAPLGYQVLGSDKVTGIIEVKAVKDSQLNNVYQFYLEKYKASTLVTVLDQQGQAADMAVSTQMLNQLANKLNSK
jgi:uncharacterized lipoprotein